MTPLNDLSLLQSKRYHTTLIPLSQLRERDREKMITTYRRQGPCQISFMHRAHIPHRNQFTGNLPTHISISSTRLKMGYRRPLPCRNMPRQEVPSPKTTKLLGSP